MTDPQQPNGWSEQQPGSPPSPPPAQSPSYDPTAYSVPGYGQPGQPPPAYAQLEVFAPPLEFSAGAAPVPPPPSYSTPDPSYPVSEYPPPAYPVTSAPAPGYGGYGGYGGYSVQPGVGYPAYAPQQKTNGMAIASMVVSIVGLVFLTCYGAGGIVGVVGAILGHVARRQIRERQESGDGMALAGVIIGWIATGLGVLVVFAIVALFTWALNQQTPNSSYNRGFNAIG